jgi:peroxiredoxin
MQYPGQLYDDRRQEIFQAQSFASSVAALLPQASQVGPGPFDAILKHMQYHYDRHPPTPYREAIRHIQRLAEAGKRGEVPAQHAMGGATPVPLTILTLDRPAPDFLVPDLVTNEAARLSRWVGRPLLLVFYNPAAASATEVLRFAQDIQAAYPEQVTVLGLAVSEDTALALKQREDLQIKFPLLSGSGLRRGYEVESTPKFVVLDSAGVMRGSYIGWGPEIPHSVTDDLKRCLDAPR